MGTVIKSTALRIIRCKGLFHRVTSNSMLKLTNIPNEIFLETTALEDNRNYEKAQQI